MRFLILGPLEAYDGERRLSLGGTKQRALLAMLLLHANEVVSNDRLVDALWGDAPTDDGAKALSVAVSRLRKVLEPERSSGAAGKLLVTRPPGYVLKLDPDHQLDLDQFERLVREARSVDDPVTSAGLLREALALWRGSPLADLEYESFGQAEIARLEESRLSALEHRIESDLTLGRHDELVGELERLTAHYPLRERLRGQLMLALYRSGRQAEALQSYQAARTSLVDELGIEPGRPLRDLHQAILEQDPGLDLVVPERPADEAPGGVFVGRGRELGELVAGLGDAFAGRGRVFLLSGEPGIGKTRLAEELMAHARGRGAHVLVGRSWEAGGAPAYWPWVQSLRAYVRESDQNTLRTQLGAGAPDLAQVVPELRELYPDLPPPSPAEPESARFRLFDATAEFLRNASERRPIVLVLDDLHAADPPSLLLLQFLAREVGSTRLLLLGVYRDVDPVPGAPLTTMLAEVARESAARRFVLDGLSESEVAEYLELTAAQMASPQLVSALHGQTVGNPLFVGEIVRLLSVEGDLPGSGDEPRLTIPLSVRDVIARRVSHLSSESDRLLVLASVLGRDFAPDVLARLGAVSGDELLEWLDEAIAARVLSDVPGSPGRLRFEHVLIRDTLYDGLTSAPPRAAARARGRGARAAPRGAPWAAPRRAGAPLDRRRRSRQGPALLASGGRPRAPIARLRGGRPPLPARARGSRPQRAAGSFGALRAAAGDGRCAHQCRKHGRRQGRLPRCRRRCADRPPTGLHGARGAWLRRQIRVAARGGRPPSRPAPRGGTGGTRRHRARAEGETARAPGGSAAGRAVPRAAWFHQP